MKLQINTFQNKIVLGKAVHPPIILKLLLMVNPIVEYDLKYVFSVS